MVKRVYYWVMGKLGFERMVPAYAGCCRLWTDCHHEPVWMRRSKKEKE